MCDVTGYLVIFYCLSHRVNVGYCFFSFWGINMLSCNCSKQCCVKVLNYETKVGLKLNFITESALKKSFPPQWSVTHRQEHRFCALFHLAHVSSDKNQSLICALRVFLGKVLVLPSVITNWSLETYLINMIKYLLFKILRK